MVSEGAFAGQVEFEQGALGVDDPFEVAGAGPEGGLAGLEGFARLGDQRRGVEVQLALRVVQAGGEPAALRAEALAVRGVGERCFPSGADFMRECS